jgi:chromate transporter
VNLALLGALAKTFALISIIAVGGATATVPEIHRQVVETMHWMDNTAFANSLAIAQVAPGPNVLIVGMIGWQVAGGAGFAVAMLAMLLPSCLLAFTVGRLMRRYSNLQMVDIARQALAPIAVGLILASGIVVTRAADRGVLTIAITGAMTLFVALTRANPLIGILAGTALGLIAGRIGFFV